MKARKDAGELTQKQFEAWSELDKGNIKEGALGIADREQNTVLHDTVFSQLPVWPFGGVGCEMATLSLPLFPSGTSFRKSGGTDLADKEQRWNWISETLIPEWLEYSAGIGKEWVDLKMATIIGAAK
jgi:hypothetical protein